VQFFHSGLSCRLVVTDALPQSRKGVRDSMMNEHATKRRFDGPHGDLVIIGKQLIHIWQKGCWRYSLLARNCGSHGTTSVILVGTYYVAFELPQQRQTVLMRSLQESHMLDAKGSWPRGQTWRPASFVGCRVWTRASVEQGRLPRDSGAPHRKLIATPSHRRSNTTARKTSTQPARE
jgi:hypothetical protein